MALCPVSRWGNRILEKENTLPRSLNREVAGTGTGVQSVSFNNHKRPSALNKEDGAPLPRSVCVFVCGGGRMLSYP